jgi:ElaB/YqjD/DUF883 family membrane-anchored ribosome-binding protein
MNQSIDEASESADVNVEGPNRGDEYEAIDSETRRQLIEAAAYRRYQARGYTHNDPLEDWIAAEQEVDAELIARAKQSFSVDNAKQMLAEKLQTLINEGQSQIEELTQKAKDASASLRKKYEAELPRAKEKLEELQAKITEVSSQSGEAWTLLREGADKASHELRQALHKVTALFKGQACSAYSMIASHKQAGYWQSPISH